MKTYREILKEADEKRVAIGHFNFATIEVAHAIVAAAKELDVPVLLGTTEGEHDFVGLHEAVALAKSLRTTYDHPIYLNADHHYSLETVKQAIDAGFDSVIFDGAKLPFEENMKITKECVAYARASGRDVIIEGELGYIGGSSQVRDALPDGVAVTEELMTTPEEASRFVEATGIDMLAPAVGNVHGMLRNAPEPRLHPERVSAIKEAAGIPLVLHGASGNTDQDLTDCITAGISIVHINTELRRAWRDALAKHITDKPDDVAPYKVLKEAREEAQKVVAGRLKVFNRLS